jgi:predicted HTH transcriptional regulator
MTYDNFWQLSESRRLEFKKSWPKGDKIAQTAIAFANGAGGKIIFGIKNEPREVIGIPQEDIFALEEKAANNIFDISTPPIVPEIYIQNIEGKSVLVVKIFPGSQKPYYIKKLGKQKGTYVRIGSVNRLASEEILLTLELEKRKISYDQVIVYDIEA